MKRAARLVLLLSAVAASAPAEEARMTPVPALDLQRYAGVWYEIARLPNPFQEKCAHYTYAVIGGPKREYLWILSREPRMP